MDILNSKDPLVFLKPKIVKIGNGNFRNYPTDLEVKNQNEILKPYLDNDDEMINCAELEDEIEIKVTKSGKFMTQFHVAQAFFSSIIGIKGLKRKEIEMDTDSHVKVPKPGETGDIIITGPSERSVASARTRVNMIVLQMRDKLAMTHFVSVPVVSEQITKNFGRLKRTLLNGPPLRGVNETIFQKPEKFHLTIAPLVLLDDVEKDLAIHTLHECKEDVLEPLFKNTGKLKLILEGLEIMNDDPVEVDVLYAKVKLNVPKYDSNFQKLADHIVEHFSRKGLIRKQYDNVKLHVTLMNSLFRKSGETTEGHNKKSVRETFDASYILKKYSEFYFGEIDLENVQLSVRFTTGDNKYYDAITTINF